MRDYNSLKKQGNTAKLYEYFSAIPSEKVEQIFKRNEVEADVLTGMLKAFSEHGLSDAKKIGNFLVSLSKAPSFDTTMMFAEDSDKEMIQKIQKAI
jgi:hypothetical protein